MRLNDFYRTAIKEILLEHFGAESKFYLFGSRVDDSKRGGDIDLYIETNLESAMADKAKSKAEWEMMEKLGEQRIDFVVHVNGKEFTPIENIARKTGVEL
jgi:predicted nucleotidyltransferase